LITRKKKILIEDPKKQIVQRIGKYFLDILILRLIQTEPMWGYKIIKKTQRLFGIKLRHGSLYPLLNDLEKNGCVKSKRVPKEGRVRKYYSITPKGEQFVKAYNELLTEQLENKDIIEG
jgi:DNA-binding PadR family transcriptional regulator